MGSAHLRPAMTAERGSIHQTFLAGPAVVGLTGVARSGKDTVGRMLVERYGFTRVAFADGLKSMAAATRWCSWTTARSNGSPS